MQDKLRALTDKLFQEGVEAGQRQADQFMTEAKNRAKNIVDEANAEARAIRERAEQEAENHRRQTHSEIVMAAHKSVQSLKQSITHMIADNLCAEEVAQALDDRQFVQKMILTALDAWAGTKGTVADLRLILSGLDRAALDKFIQSKCRHLFAKGCEVKWDDQIKSGFKIASRDGGYVVEFSEESFRQFLSQYLRPDVRRLVFDDPTHDQNHAQNKNT